MTPAGTCALASPAAAFSLLAAVDEALRHFLSAAGRPDLVVALVADRSLPQAVCGDRERFVRLLRGLLEGALQYSRGAELLLDVTLLEEDPCWAWVRFSAGDDLSRLGSEPRDSATLCLSWRFRKPAPPQSAPSQAIN